MSEDLKLPLLLPVASERADDYSPQGAQSTSTQGTGNGGSTMRKTSKDHKAKDRSQRMLLKTFKTFRQDHPDLIRTCSSLMVLRNFASVFKNENQAPAPVKEEEEGQSLRKSQSIKEEAHKEADAVFYSTKQNDKIDAFISHVWMASRWRKALALMYYMNFGLATVMSLLTWALSTFLILWLEGNFNPLVVWNSPYLTPGFVWLPTFVWMLFFFFGQRLTFNFFEVQMWLDKSCIHQTRSDKKIAAVSALDDFVCASDRMLILWDESYFERLWCNLEVATFCLLKGCADNIDLCPLWLPPWLLSTIVLDLLSNVIFTELTFLTPLCSHAFGFQIGLVVGVGLNLAIPYAIIVVPNTVSFRRKIRDNQNMQELIDNYSLADAKCTFESDRPVVESRIVGLFLGGVTHKAKSEEITDQEYDDALDQYDRFIRTEVKSHIQDRIGLATEIRYRLAFVAFLPLILSSMVDILGCDGGECIVTAAAEGFAGPWAFLVTTSLNWIMGSLLVYPVTYPMTLSGMVWCMQRIPNGFLQILCCAMCNMLAYLHMGFMEGLVCYLNTCMSNDGPSASWLILVAYLFFVNFVFFWQKEWQKMMKRD
eukprot:gnl/MRDRNA2_/MRDRNA2_84280_c0_seq1.p1 gnl/MRDRNA2_/MRDRNA2_84280_c0~~gnl/MRDRNA2_/MRDRNA2_84280_c0_seq1.p1  ORF type:complete len:595 (-),score=88.92 gnl/MRDRNA2_/MRDRNA2_84280_c0_seq1:279-2063(-)